LTNLRSQIAHHFYRFASRRLLQTFAKVASLDVGIFLQSHLNLFLNFRLWKIVRSQIAHHFNQFLSLRLSSALGEGVFLDV
jgi:hypothetical protein